MPLYKYRCLNCSNVFTALAAYDEQLKCDNCGSETKRDFPRPKFSFGQGASLVDEHESVFAEVEAHETDMGLR